MPKIRSCAAVWGGKTGGFLPQKASGRAESADNFLKNDFLEKNSQTPTRKMFFGKRICEQNLEK